MNTVKIVSDNNLCCSCGICKNVCPKKAIIYKKDKGMYIPEISEDCVECGKCISVCPSVKHEYDHKNIDDAMVGNISHVYNAWSKNSKIRHYGASAGVVSTIVKVLLDKNIYDCVFSLDTYNYSKQLKTKKFNKDTYNLSNVDKQKFTKSRYLPVSHENLINYIINNPESKVIVIGTSCSVRGICKVIEKYKLNRNNYLIIGLFCDQVFNYNVYDYFSNKKFTGDKTLNGLHFKNKDSGGWPGNIKLMFSDGTSAYLDKNERVKCKDFFKPERCQYCIDKLNIMADISIGDNYTDSNSTSLGSNSVIIRTKIGLDAIGASEEYLELHDIDIESIKKAQYFEERKNNYYYAKVKKKKIKEICDINSNMTEDNYKNYLQAYDTLLTKIRIGEEYGNTQNPNLLNSSFKSNLFKKVKYAILRRF